MDNIQIQNEGCIKNILCNSKAIYINWTFYKIPPPPPGGPGNDFLTGGADKQQQQQQKSSFRSRCADAELTSKKEKEKKKALTCKWGCCRGPHFKITAFSTHLLSFWGFIKNSRGAVTPIFSGGQHPCPPPPPGLK